MCIVQYPNMWLRFLFIVTIHIIHAKSANILGIIPTASYSHQVPFHPLWKELSLRGHSLTVITSHPMKDSSLINLTEIDISYTRDIYKKYKFNTVASDPSKSTLEVADVMLNMIGEAEEEQLSSPEIQNLIHNKSIHFDLIMVEAQLPGMMAFSWRFNAPMIGITSLDSGKLYHKFMGNQNHPVINPDHNFAVYNPENFTFKERLLSLIYDFVNEYIFMYKKTYPQSHERFKKFFGENLPPFTELHQNMVMLIINTNPIFQNVRALNPNTIAIGGTLHIKKPQPLPKDLQEYLDNSKDGVIYFSLGSNIPGYQIDNILREILPGFSELPYKFLVKVDLELKDIPNNVRIEKWYPQQDILRHPNLKLFITQGGLQSLQEAVLNAVPLIGIPFFGDQFLNVHKMMAKGYGLKLDKSNITKESIKDAIYEVLNNSKYRERAREMSEILRDEEMPSCEKAVWWIEYVLRHKGAQHFKSPAATMPFWKFYVLDVIGFVLTTLIVFMYIVFTLSKWTWKKFVTSNKIKKQAE